MHFSKRETLQRYAHKPKQKGLTDFQLSKSFLTEVEQCDDRFNIYIQKKNDIIEVARFDGAGCAVSLGSTEALLSVIEGKSVNEVNNIIYLYERFLNNESNDINEELKVFEIVHTHKSRTKCAMAPIEAIKKGIKNNE